MCLVYNDSTRSSISLSSPAQMCKWFPSRSGPQRYVLRRGVLALRGDIDHGPFHLLMLARGTLIRYPRPIKISRASLMLCPCHFSV